MAYIARENMISQAYFREEGSVFQYDVRGNPPTIRQSGLWLIIETARLEAGPKALDI